MKSHKIITYVIICCLLLSSISILTSSYNLNNSIQSQPHSHSTPDSIHIKVRTKVENSAEDVANGQLESFLFPLSGGKYDSLSSEVKERTGKWRSEDSYYSLYFNPAHTASPYECNVDGKIRFNPFAIEEVRYAANFLLDRKKVISDFYNGHAEPRYLPFSQSSPAYDDHYENIVEKRGFTAEVSKQKGIEMVQQGLTSAMNDPELKGELKPPSNNSQFWEYKTPNGTFEPVEVRGIIRIEDEREEIGEYFSDLLRDCNLKVDERKNTHISYGYIIWSSDPAELQWNFYTGGWLSDRAEYYGEMTPAMMYSGWYGYMPGGFVSDADYRYGYYEDGAAWDADGEHGVFYGNLTLENITKRLFEGQMNSKEQYWDYMERGVDLGVEEAIRVYICSDHEYYLYNKSRVRSASTNVLSGWDDIFTPRTIEISKDDLNLAQYSAQGTLFYDNWNELGGSSDIYGLSMKRMLMDVGTTLHPSSGKPVPVRCNWYEEENWYEKRGPTSMVKRDYSWKTNETGDLVLNRNISVPDDAVIYNSTTNQWEEVGHGVRSAVKVTYSIVGGKWHSGANLTLRDVMGWHAWSWEMSFKDGSNDEYYHEGFADKNEDRFRSIKGEHWDKDNQTYTIWGDYTMPIDSKIGYYYSIWPAVPYYQYEAAQFLVNQNDEYIPSDTGTYSWDNYEKHWIHWLSEEQGQDIVDTLQNMIEKEYIPWYLKEENNAPITVSQGIFEEELESVIDFYYDHHHVFVSNGPFMADNISNKSANFVRFTQEDGYPFAEDYFRKILSEKKLRIESMEVPSIVEIGDELEVTVDCKVYESYPDDLVRNLTEDDNPSAELILMKDGEEISKINPSLIDSAFKGKFNTSDLTPGRYTVKFVGNLPDMIKNVTKSQNVVIEDSHVEVGVYALYITPSRIPIGGDVEIVAWGITSDDYSITVSFMVDNETIKMIDIPNGTEFEIQEEYTFDDPGTHEISFGGEVGTVTVVQPIPKVSDFDVPDKKIVREEVTISAVVENTEQFEYNYSLLIDGNIVSNIDLEPGESKTVTIQHVFESTGSHTVSIGDEKKIIDIVEQIVVEDVDIDDDEIKKGEKVKITAEITNNDDVERNVDIYIEGDMVGSLNVKPGTDSYTYKHKFDEKGTYEITVGNQSAGKISVSSDNKNDSRWISGFQISILLISISFITLLHHIKKKKRV